MPSEIPAAEERFSLTEREVRIIAGEVAREVVGAWMAQVGLRTDHLVHLRIHAEAMMETQSSLRRKLTDKVVDFAFLLMVGGIFWYLK